MQHSKSRGRTSTQWWEMVAGRVGTLWSADRPLDLLMLSCRWKYPTRAGSSCDHLVSFEWACAWLGGYVVAATSMYHNSRFSCKIFFPQHTPGTGGRLMLLLRVCTARRANSCTLLLCCGLIAPQEPVNNMALTRSIVATLVILVGVVQLAVAASTCDVCSQRTTCEDVTPAVVPGLVTPAQNPNAAVKVCVTQVVPPQTLVPVQFLIGGCANTNPPVDAASVSCPSRTYVYSLNSAGLRITFRSGSGGATGFPLSTGGATCGAQRGFCLNKPAGQPSATIDTSGAPYKIKVGTFVCNVATGFADNKWQLYCA
jgi:hypothetical protein